MTVLEQWLTNKIYHKENANYIIHELMANKIAIYGAGRMGELIYDELLEHPLELKYFIDKNADSIYYGIDDMKIYNLEEVKCADPVDLIIVTPYHYFDEIKKELELTLDFCPRIVSLEEIIARTE